jgi:uncharacterized protein DUF2510
MTGQTPAGWYPDPYGTPGLRRYWDGGQWTQATQPVDDWNDTEGAAPADYASPSGPSTPQPWASPGGSGGRPADQGPPNWNWNPSSGGGPVTPRPWQQPGATPQPWQQPGATPQPWQQPGATPQPWQQPGATPQPWQQPGATPQPWQAGPPPSSRSNQKMLWLLGGGGALLLVLILVAALFAAGVFDGDEEPLPGPSPGATSDPPVARPSVDPSGRSPVSGTIEDDGISYARLGGGWSPETVSSESTFAKKYGFNRGESAVVQDDYEGSSEYLASAYSGRLPSSVSYSGEDDLEEAAESLAEMIETEPPPNGAYPSPHTRQDLESRSYTVSGEDAWLLRFRLDFPQAASRGWNFRSETAVFILVDRGSGERPSVFWVTVPDSHTQGGDLSQLVDSLKVE